jgi:MFS transporter, PPP family, 3-phenylpropionic acid transporter
MKTPRPAFLSSALYFSYYLALGAIIPFINLYYERLGLSGLQIGALTAIPVLISSTAVLLWSSLADTLRWHRRILRIGLFLSAATILLLSTATTFEGLLGYIVIYAFFMSPVVPLLDSWALEAAEDSHRSYGELRLWGAVGWSISTVLVGLIIQRFGIHWLFYCYVALLLLTFFIALFQPRRKVIERQSLRHGLRTLLLNYPILLFLLAVFLVSLSLNANLSFFSIYLDTIGASEGAIGLGWAIASLSEIPVMLFSGRIARRIGATGLLKVAFTIFAIRWLLYSFITTPALALAVQALHGLSFGAYLVGGVTYINERTPAGLSTTAQALLNLVSFGLSSIAGSLLGGYLFETLGFTWFFRLLTLIVLLAFALFLLSQRLGTTTQTAPPALEQ